MAAPALQWPPAPDEPRLAVVESFRLIARPIDEVFEFATNASLWRHWNPFTIAVTDTPPRPLQAGEQATESVRARGRRIPATWTVLACEPPSLWVIATSTPVGDARIVYELRSDGARLTRFFRTLAYRSRRWPWILFDANLTRSALGQRSEQALDNLRRVLEAGRHG